MKELLNRLNEKYEGIFDFDFEDGKYIVDHCEEFYYDGFLFDKVQDIIEAKVKELYGEDAYIDCCCPGRWIIAE